MFLWGKVAPPPQNGKLELGSEQHFTFQVTVTLAVGKVPPRIEIGLNMNALERNHFNWGQQVHFTIYPHPLPSSYFMPEKETCEFQFQMDIWKYEFFVFRSQWYWSKTMYITLAPHQDWQKWSLGHRDILVSHHSDIAAGQCTPQDWKVGFRVDVMDCNNVGDIFDRNSKACKFLSSLLMKSFACEGI